MATRTDSAARMIKGGKLRPLLVILQYFVFRPSAILIFFVVFLF